MPKKAPLNVRISDDKVKEVTLLLQQGLNASEVARRARLARETVCKVRDSLGLPPASRGAGRASKGLTGPTPAQDRRSLFDADFWRKKAKAAENELSAAENTIQQLSGIRSIPFSVPDFSFKEAIKASKPYRAVGCCFVSDLHAGEVISGEELHNLNEYNPDICRRRMERYFQAACEIIPRWSSDTRLEGMVLFVGGDLISGDIHDELRETNALTSHEQVLLACEILSGGISLLQRKFGTVFVVSVPGNHGRSTPKSHAKRNSRLSYDTLILKMVEERVRHPNIHFHVPNSRDAIVPVLGWTVFMNHGDSLGTGGGQGFAGPMLPIVRGAKKAEHAAFRAKRHYDLMLTAHYHSSGNPSGILANGSVPGYSEYGNGLRCSFEVPQQWLFLIHEKWGLRERCEIKLEDPVPPPLPRVRVPSSISG